MVCDERRMPGKLARCTCAQIELCGEPHPGRIEARAVVVVEVRRTGVEPCVEVGRTSRFGTGRSDGKCREGQKCRSHGHGRWIAQARFRPAHSNDGSARSGRQMRYERGLGTSARAWLRPTDCCPSTTL